MSKSKGLLPPQPPDHELEAAACHVAYEVRAFVAATLRLEAKPKDPWVENALVESMAIHFRNLQEFFFFSEGKKDDARAFHYIEGWPEGVHGAGAFAALRDRVSKQVGHLTYARVRYTKKEFEWPLPNMGTTIRAVWGEFWARVPPERRPWFDLKPEDLALICPPAE